MKQSRLFALAMIACFMLTSCSENDSANSISDNVSQNENSVDTSSSPASDTDSVSAPLTVEVTSALSESQLPFDNEEQVICAASFIGSSVGDVSALLDTSYSSDGFFMGSTMFSCADESTPYALMTPVEMPDPDTSRVTGVVVWKGGMITDKLVSGMSYNEMAEILGKENIVEPHADEMDGSICSYFVVGEYTVIIKWTDYSDNDSPSYNATIYMQSEPTPEEQAVLDGLYGNNDYTEPETPSQPEWVEPVITRDDLPDMPKDPQTVKLVKGYLCLFGKDGILLRDYSIQKTDVGDNSVHYIINDASGYSCDIYIAQYDQYNTSTFALNISPYQMEDNYLYHYPFGIIKIGDTTLNITNSSTYEQSFCYFGSIPNSTVENEFFYDINTGNAYFGNYTFDDSGNLISMSAVCFSDQLLYTIKDGVTSTSNASNLLVHFEATPFLTSNTLSADFDYVNNSRKDIRKATFYYHAVDAFGEIVADVDTGKTQFTSSVIEQIETGDEGHGGADFFITNSTAEKGVLDGVVVEYMDGTSRTFTPNNITFY